MINTIDDFPSGNRMLGAEMMRESQSGDICWNRVYATLGDDLVKGNISQSQE